MVGISEMIILLNALEMDASIPLSSTYNVYLVWLMTSTAKFFLNWAKLKTSSLSF